MKKIFFKILIITCLSCIIESIYAQGNPPVILPFDPLKVVPLPENRDSVSTQRKKVEISNADELSQFTDTITNVLQRKLKGNVKLRHEGAIMTCDSAILFPDANYLEALSRVKIIKGDSINISAHSLKYFGDTKYALLEKDVILKDKNSTLKTPKLDYDVENDIGNFFEGGVLTTDSTEIKSRRGTYFEKTKDAIFKDNVVLSHPDYTMFADSMRYNSTSKIAYFISPTTILQGADTIFTKDGYFDTKNNVAYFGKRPKVKKENDVLQSDQLDYDKKAGTGIAKGNVVYENPKEKITMLSNLTEYADSNSFVRATQNPLMIQEGEKDTTYLSADTLINYKVLSEKDTLLGKQDSFKITYGYRDVRMLRSKMSGRCDSLYYTSQDSIFRLHFEPKLWMDSTQMTADTVWIYLKNEEVYRVDLKSNAFIAMLKDTEIFHQIKGRQVTAYLEDEKIKSVIVDGNAESIYFIQDDSSAYIGGNQSKSSDIVMNFEKGEIKRIRLNLQPEAVFTPMQQITPSTFRLDGFQWLIDLKPLSKWDIIRDSSQYETYLIQKNFPDSSTFKPIINSDSNAFKSPSMKPSKEKIEIIDASEDNPAPSQTEQPGTKSIPSNPVKGNKSLRGRKTKP